MLIICGDVEHMLLSDCILVSLRLTNSVFFPKPTLFCVCFSRQLQSCIVTVPLLQPPSHSSSISVQDATTFLCAVGKQSFIS